MAEPSHLAATRTAYDTVADDYADLLRDDLAGMPWDRALLAVFAELVLAGGAQPVADLGCGPGRVTAHLAGLGLDVFGVDLSPGMVSAARRDHPHLRFEVADLASLPIEDDSLGGALAWYSVIHTPPEHLPPVFEELHRVVAPGGHLLLAFQVGDEQVRHEQAYGHRVSYDAYRLPVDRVTGLLTDVGFVVSARVVREAEGREKTEQAYVLARRPAR